MSKMTASRIPSIWSFKKTLFLATVFGHGLFSAAAVALDTRAAECVSSVTDGPVLVTLDCVDPKYDDLILDGGTDEVSPFPHHKVSAHFNESGIEIRVYLPPKDQWGGRFFQYVYPNTEADASDDDISFALDSGAYWVQSNGTTGYRSDAAAAKFSRNAASKYYDLAPEDIYGYIFGGSGGSFKAVSAIENTLGVWNGAVPYIQAVPVSVPLSFCIRALAGLVLKDKADQIIDAVRPGGSGDPYDGLNQVEAAILKEATLMGIPLNSWEDFAETGGVLSLTLLMDNWKKLDATYRDDFWSLPGYLGTETSALGDIIRAALVNTTLSVANVGNSVNGSMTTVAFETFPEINDTRGLDFTLLCGNATAAVGALTGTLDTTEKLLYLSATANATVVDAISTSCQITIDNTWLVAMSGYHRHQLPSRSGFYGFDQFRDAAGAPLYVQRSPEIAPLLARSSSDGGTHTGNITGKVIVVDTLLDSDAFPWHADWYASTVRSALGSDGAFADSYRVWYNEHANHVPPETRAAEATRVSYWGMLQQAMRDLAAWVERGDASPESTAYDVRDSQIRIPAAAADRRGIQPAVALAAANANANVNAAVGEPVAFDVSAQVPPGAGEVVSVEWDPLGTGDYAEVEVSCAGGCGATASETVQATYGAAGTYFPVVRVTSQREGNRTSPFARVSNLGRARVVVQ